VFRWLDVYKAFGYVNPKTFTCEVLKNYLLIKCRRSFGKVRAKVSADTRAARYEAARETT
jgi:hypothetical protein